MNEKITFCEECRKDVIYYIEDIDLKSTLKGEEYTYRSKKAICSECNNEVYVASIEDENLKSLYDAYRHKNDIIPLEKILEIPQKYNIGKRPLSQLLNWGELTFTRYCEGGMPTKLYSDTLQKIYDTPEFYISLLEDNKKAISSIAYEKSKKAALELFNEKEMSESKIYYVIEYLLYQCEDVTPLALQKALYYIQGLYYAFWGKFLFEDDCEAWIHGPVYRDVYDRYSKYRFDPIESVEAFDTSIFTNIEKSIIDSVAHHFCCYSGKILEHFTHSEMPWIKTRGDLHSDEASTRIISKDLIGKYFIAVKEKYNMLTTNDIENYAKDMFSKTTNF